MHNATITNTQEKHSYAFTPRTSPIIRLNTFISAAVYFRSYSNRRDLVTRANFSDLSTGPPIHSLWFIIQRAAHSIDQIDRGGALNRWAPVLTCCNAKNQALQWINHTSTDAYVRYVASRPPAAHEHAQSENIDCWKLKRLSHKDNASKFN